MKSKFSLLILILLCKILQAQNVIGFDVKFAGLSPISPYSSNFKNDFNNCGGALNKNSFSVGTSLKYIFKKNFFLAIKYDFNHINYIKSTYSISSLFTETYSKNPQEYSSDVNKYWYNIKPSKVKVHNIQMEFGYLYTYKKLLFESGACVGFVVFTPPSQSVDEYLYDSTFVSSKPLQTRPPSSYVRTVEVFAPKSIFAFSYGIDVAFGFTIVKGLNVSAFASYTGSTNIKYSYFSSYQLGYTKTIQQISYGIKLGYLIHLKKFPAIAGLAKRDF